MHGWKGRNWRHDSSAAPWPCPGVSPFVSVLAAARRPDQLLNVGCEIEAVRPAFDRYVHGDEVRFTAAFWMVNARADARRALGQSPTFGFAWIARSSDGLP